MSKIGIMEKKMETTKDYMDYIGGFTGIIGYILGLYGDNSEGLGPRVKGVGLGV